MEEKRRFYRSDDKMIGGVCGGIAEYFNLDPSMVRIAYALLTIFTIFSGVIVYAVMWIVVPLKPKLPE